MYMYTKIYVCICIHKYMYIKMEYYLAFKIIIYFLKNSLAAALGD